MHERNMTATLAVYFDYKGVVNTYGGEKAKKLMDKHIELIFSKMSSGPKTKMCSLLLADGVTETEDSTYGSIAVFEYKNAALAESSARQLTSWVSRENRDAPVKLPILGLVYSKGLVLTSDCASALFSNTLSYETPIYCVDGGFDSQSKLLRIVSDNRLVVKGQILCTRPTVYVACAQEGSVVKISKTSVHSAIHDACTSRQEPIVLYSYDGGNLLIDCDFVLYIQALYAIATSERRTIISPDLRESTKYSSMFNSKVFLYGIMSYSYSGSVGFDEKTQKFHRAWPLAHTPYTKRATLFNTEQNS